MHTLVRLGLLSAFSIPLCAHAASWALQKETGSRIEMVTASYEDAHGKVSFICRNGALDAYVMVASVRMALRSPVTYRIDGGAITTGTWSKLGADFLPSPKLDFARALLNGRKLSLEIVDYHKQTHRFDVPLDGARDAVGAAIKACHYEFEGLETRIPGLRPEIARDLEAWGPPYTKAAKKVLRAAGAYAGPLDTPIDAEFALAAQKHHDQYVAECQSGAVEGDYFCQSIREAFLENEPAYDYGVGAIIYDSAKGELREEMGSIAPSRR
jgi:hypothetical protein